MDNNRPPPGCSPGGNHSGFIEEGEAAGLGCNLPQHLPSSYSSSATREAGAVAALTEERKMARYAHLNRMHAFTPVAIETSGVFGP